MQLPPGILPAQWIRDALASGVVTADVPVTEGQIQPNSLDLRLSKRGHRVQCSFLPGNRTVGEKLKALSWYELDLDDHAGGKVLEPNQVYLFRLEEDLALPPDISARANPKSSTGRLDVFTRVITDTGRAFDEVAAGYRGPLYLEIVPRSFAIRVRRGDSLAQIRFQTGEDPAAWALTDTEAAALLDSDDIVIDADGRARRSAGLKIRGGVYLSVRVIGEKKGETVGFRARKSTAPIDLRTVGKVPVSQHWERIYSRPSVPLILEPDAFYIFASKELIRLPPGVCAEMVPFDAGSGEVRTHYAGFFDSGFGWAPDLPASRTAAAVVLEIRNRDVPFLLDDGQPLFRFELLRNAWPPEVLYGQDLRSNYQGQRLRLGKQFQQASTGARRDQTALPL